MYALFLPRQVVAGAGPVEVHERGGQPVAQLVAGAAAVEGQDERLAVLVVPEADAGRLPLLHRPAAAGPLAEVVVQAVDARGQRDFELVGSNEAAAGRADGIDALEVTGGLGLGEVVSAGREVEEDGGAVRVGQLRGGLTALPRSCFPAGKLTLWSRGRGPGGVHLGKTGLEGAVPRAQKEGGSNRPERVMRR
jgi:hypothetical protein